MFVNVKKNVKLKKKCKVKKNVMFVNVKKM